MIGLEKYGMENCACTGANLPRFVQPALLAIIAAGPAHGYNIMHQLAGSGVFEDILPDATGIYRILKTMEQDGSLESEWDTSESGPAKKCYSITARGRECLANWQKTLKRHEEFLQRLQTLVSEAAGCEK